MINKRRGFILIAIILSLLVLCAVGLVIIDAIQSKEMDRLLFSYLIYAIIYSTYKLVM